MTKIFTKISLLFIGLMLCAGNAWSAGTYNNENGSSGSGYYQETISGITYRIDYTYTKQETDLYPMIPGVMVQTTINRTPVTITSCNDHEDDYKIREAHAYVVGEFTGNTALTFANSITLNTSEAKMNGSIQGSPFTTTVPVCLKKSNFNNYSGKITLPAYPADGKAIVYEGWSVRDERYTDANYGDPFTYVFGENVTVEAPKLSDQAKYNAQEVNYFGTYLNPSSSAYIHDDDPQAHPWNGHLTHGTASESYNILVADEDENWILYENGILLVAYEGTMPNFSDKSSPWYGNRDKIYAVKIAASVTSIGAYAFQGCENLSEVIFLGNNVTSFGQYCFQECDMLQNFDVPSGVTTIDLDIFNGCGCLLEVNLPSSVTTIAEGAFFGTHILKEVTILNESPTNTIHSGAFNSVSNVIIPDAAACAYINLHNENAWTSNVFKSVTTGDELECNEVNNSCGTDLTWEYNDGVLTISGEGTDMADYNNSGNLCPWSANLANITSIVLPNTLEHIGDYAFNGCTGLKEVTIPASVTEIGEGAFLGCSSLKALHMEGYAPDLTKIDYTSSKKGYPFEGVLDVYVPVDYLANYQTSWTGNFPEVSTSNVEATLDQYMNIYSLSYEQAMGYLQPMIDAGIMDVTPVLVYSGCQLSYYPVGAGEVGDDIVGCSDNTAANTNDKLEELAANGGTLLDRFTIVRPIQANGYLNTLCLPFDMDADDIAASDLNGAEIFEFNEQQSGTTVEMVLSQVTEIEAGMPYFFRYPNGTPGTPNLSELNFYDVTVSTADVTPKTVDAGTFRLVGTLDNQLLNSGTNYLFLGAENSLFYPDLEGATEDELTIRPFRAYFESTGGASLAPARFVFGRQTPTDIENIESNNANVDKTIENCQLFILKNGVKYNAQGQVVK